MTSSFPALLNPESNYINEDSEFQTGDFLMVQVLLDPSMTSKMRPRDVILLTKDDPGVIFPSLSSALIFSFDFVSVDELKRLAPFQL